MHHWRTQFQKEVQSFPFSGKNEGGIIKKYYWVSIHTKLNADRKYPFKHTVQINWPFIAKHKTYIRMVSRGHRFPSLAFLFFFVCVQPPQTQHDTTHHRSGWMGTVRVPGCCATHEVLLSRVTDEITISWYAKQTLANRKWPQYRDDIAPSVERTQGRQW